MSNSANKITRHFKLDVYKKSVAAAMKIFELSRKFPAEERYSLTDQMRRSSRSVSANLAEAWRKRIYPAHFVTKLNDSEAEAAETQTWLRFAVDCGYLKPATEQELSREYEAIIAMLVSMRRHPETWCIG